MVLAAVAEVSVVVFVAEGEAEVPPLVLSPLSLPVLPSVELALSEVNARSGPGNW